MKKKKSNSSEDFLTVKPKTYESICKEQLEKLPNIDLRNDFRKGQIVYYVFENRLTHTAESLEVSLTTIYPQNAIGINTSGYSVVIPYNDIDNVFEIPIKAERKLKEIRKELSKYESEDFI